MDTLPDHDRLATLARWRAASLGAGIVLSIVPLMLLPGLIATALEPYHPVPAPIDAASIGIVLSLGIALTLGPLVGVPLRAVFVRRPDRSILAWAAFGVLLVGAVVTATALAVGGTITVERRSPEVIVEALLAAALLAVWAAVLEEFLVRGYLLSLLGHRWDWPAAVATTSALFAVLHHGHATNEISLVLYLGTASVAGVLFALVTLSTGTVWSAVAIHATWNSLFSARVVSFQDASSAADETLVTYALGADPLLVGGGAVDLPESPISIAVLLAGVGVVVGSRRWRTA